jgi:hypothetical protein
MECAATLSRLSQHLKIDTPVRLDIVTKQPLLEGRGSGLKHCYSAMSVSVELTRFVCKQDTVPLRQWQCTQVRGRWEGRTPQNYPRRSLIFTTSHIAICRIGGVEKYNYGFIMD